MSDPSSKPPKKDRSLWRRVARLMAWALAALGVSVLLAWLVLQSDWLRERIRLAVEVQAGEALGREVTLGSIDFELFPPAAEISDLVVGGPDGIAEPLASVSHASVSIGPGLIAGIRGKGPIELREIIVSEPLVQLIFYEDGSSNLPELPEREGTDDGLEIWIGRLTVEDGLFIIDEREAPLDFSVRELSASLRQTGETSYIARADSSETTIVLPDSKPLAARLAIEAEIAEGGIEIREALVEGSHLTATASASYRDEVLSVELNGEVDAALLTEAGWVEPDPGEPDAPVLEGTASLQGKFRLTESVWEIDGSFESPLLSFGELMLSDIEGTVGGGSEKLLVAVRKGGFEGARAEAAIGIDLTAEEPQIFVQAMIAGLDLATYLEALELPLSGIQGIVDADGMYFFTASAPEAGEGQFMVAVEPPGSIGPDDVLAADPEQDVAPPASGLPLTGGLEVRLADGLLSFEDTGLSAPDQRIEISGEVTLETLAGAVDFRLETEDPKALLRALPDLYDEEGILVWEPTVGRGELSGRASFEGEVFRAELQIDLESVVLAGVEVPSLEGDLTIDSAAVQRLHLEAVRGEERMVLSGVFPFDEAPAGFELPPFRFDLESDGWDLADTGPFLPFDMPPFYGSFYGSFRMWGDLDAPEGELQARVIDLRYEDLELPGELQGPIRFDAEEVVLGPIRYLSEAGDVEFVGTMDLVAETMEMELVSSPLSLTAEPFDSMIAGDLSGTVDVGARIGGTFDSPEVEAGIAGSGLVLDGAELGEDGSSNLEISLASGQLDVSGSLLGLISAQGGGAFTEEATDVAVTIGSEYLRELVLIALGQAPEALGGSFEGTFTLSRIGEALEGRIIVDHVTVANELSRLSNVEPVVVVFDERGGFLELLYLREEDTGSELIVVGDLGGADQEMNLFIDSSIDASWIGLYLPDVDLSGQLQILASVGGEPSAPVIDGQAQISEGRLIMEGFPHALEDIEGLLFLYPDRIVIDAGRAEFARGELRAEGTVLMGETDFEYEIRILGADMDIRYPEDWQIRADAILTLSGNSRERRLHGRVDVERASFVRDFQLGFSSLMRAMFQRTPELVDETDEFLRATALNIQVYGPEALFVQTNMAELRGDLDFALRGTAADPIILGSVTLDRGSEIDFGGNEYTIERGELTFSNPFRNDPEIDLVASATVREFQVQLNVFGPFDQLETSLSSSPPMPNLDILSLLTTGSADSLDSFGSERSVVDDGSAGGAEAFLASQAASIAGQRVGSLFGLDQVQISPITQGSASLSAARITVGKRISRDIYVTYSYDPSSSDEQIVEVAWRISPHLSLIITETDSDSVSFDVRWNNSF